MPTKQIERVQAAGVAVKSRRSKAAEPEQDLWPWWVSEPPGLIGNPTPAWEHFNPDVDFFHGDRCGRFAHKVDNPLFGWQWDSMRKILATREDGLWAHPDVCLVIPRQNGKTEIVVFRILYGLFYLGEKIVYSAQRWKTVEDVYDRIVAIIESRPSLRRRLAPAVGCPKGYSKYRQHGEVHLNNGASLDMGPRTKAVGRGQTKINLVIFDEAYAIKDLIPGGLRGAQLASGNRQTIYVSTAPVVDLHPDCHVFANQRRNGLRGEPDLYAAEWCAPRDLSRDDPEAWRMAAPSFGVTIQARDVAAELRAARATAATMAEFEADYLGWGMWPPDPDVIDRPIPKEVWADLVNLSPALVGDACIAVSRTSDRKWWCIAGGQRTVDGRVHLEVGYWQQANIGQVGAAVLTLVDLWDPPAVVVDAKDPGAALAPYLLKQGIEMVVTSAPQYAVATSGLIDGVMASDVTHTGQQLLGDVVEVAETRELPRGDIVWDDTSHPAMAALKAMTLAHWAVLNFAEERGPAAAPASGAPVDLDSPAYHGDGGSVLEAGF